MKGTKLLTVALALLTLLALKAYIDWSLDQPKGLPHPEPAWATTPLLLAEPLGDDPVGLLLRLNASLRRLRGSVPEADAYWNRQQHGLFRALEGGPANGTWGCGDGLAAAAAIRDFASYPEQHQRFVLHAECRSFPLLVNQPRKCAGNRTFLLLAIKSVPGNFAARQAVRETWGREGEPGGQPVRTLFLMGAARGQHQPDLRHLIAYESRAYGDVLVWDFEDTFFNLTLKDFLFLGWALAHCPDARFVLKGDDDVFINTPRVLAFLGPLTGRRAQTLYTGQVMANASPFRQATSKYYIPESFYAGPYPAYAGGGGYIFSGRLAPALFLVAQHLAFYPIDDVYTGLCFQALGVRAEAHPEFQTFDIAEKDRADPCAHRQLLLVHRRSPQQTVRLWRQLHDPQLKC
ncbi:UDP-GlcNAc:betaGal beta-1,3-N-acetylglucosaminyltransferase 8 [Terrapene carolina triunguis]|uniref:Hexosyltransferase n=1 Tax=Terrapene triunguis TaxID=2587831 RepID=A0A674IAE4_9SAUR|nr:UDP-GlcNAc:betaGal beta-1,3-N-acetylglucosaminyltransferase 8 [Terrapene carolina triunguis]XP_024072115.1 UDP-GlcNAc:betaGal beta-1,3-N-acetylglucosaminyltransferase 8 [Terrapene carolina triunguis]XP_024072116.1 UDP-GlcNAc:betaGal beta-1,3-N-acetylglucosaminyltransferase 8 [Terrapene carolina triunguis]